MADEKKCDAGRVLVMGGCGFIGRNIVLHIVKNNLADEIVVADKTLPALAGFNPDVDAAFKDPRVKTQQRDLQNPAHVAKVFDAPYDYVFNCSGETRPKRTEQDYENRILQVTQKCAAAALAAGCKKWVQLSSARIYQTAKTPGRVETTPLEPWTQAARFHARAEEVLRGLTGLPAVFLRPAIVYGPGDRTGLMPRLVCAAVYVHLGEVMEFLWSKGVNISAVHVRDVASAAWIAAAEAAPGSIFNLADECLFTQGMCNPMIQRLFGIKCKFANPAKNRVALNYIDRAAAYSNDKHVPAWSEMCQKHNIDTPLSPYMDSEILLKHHLCINGSLITKKTSFRYQHPAVTDELLREMVQDVIDQGKFPPVLAPPKK